MAELRRPAGVAKAREHATVFERGVPYNTRVSDFDRVTVREAALIRFDSSSRDDHILIYWTERPAI